MASDFAEFISERNALLPGERAVHPLLLEALAALTIDHGGCQMLLGDLTTREAVEWYIKPATAHVSRMSLVEALHAGSVTLPRHPLSKDSATGSSYITVNVMEQCYSCWHDSGDGGHVVSTCPVVLNANAKQPGTTTLGHKIATCSTDDDVEDAQTLFYVSHAWDSKFGDLAKAVMNHYEAQMWSQLHSHEAAKFKAAAFLSHKRDEWYCHCQVRTSYYWIDVLALSQNQPLELVEEVVQDVISASQSLLLATAPKLDTPLATKRLWCLYELLVATELKKPVHLIMAQPHWDRHQVESWQQAAQVFESIEASQFLSADLNTAETTCPADRDHLVRLINVSLHTAMPQPSSSLDHGLSIMGTPGNMASAMQLLQARLRAAAAESIFWSVLLTRFAPSAVWRCRQIADSAARQDACQVVTELDLFQIALQSQPSSTAMPCGLASSKVQQRTSTSAVGQGRRKPAVKQASLLEPYKLESSIHADTSSCSGTQAEAYADTMSHSSTSNIAPGSHGGHAHTKVIVEISTHVDNAVARLLQEARLAHPAVAHVPLKISCNCTSCMKLITKAGLITKTRQQQQRTGLPLLFPSYCEHPGTCTASGIPIVSLHSILHSFDGDIHAQLGHMSNRGITGSSNGAGLMHARSMLHQRSVSGLPLMKSGNTGLVNDNASKPIDQLLLASVSTILGFAPGAHRPSQAASLPSHSVHDSPRVSLGGLAAPSTDALVRRSQLGNGTQVLAAGLGSRSWLQSAGGPLHPDNQAGTWDLSKSPFDIDSQKSLGMGRAANAVIGVPRSTTMALKVGMDRTQTLGSSVPASRGSVSGSSTSLRFEELADLPSLGRQDVKGSTKPEDFIPLPLLSKTNVRSLSNSGNESPFSQARSNKLQSRKSQLFKSASFRGGALLNGLEKTVEERVSYSGLRASRGSNPGTVVAVVTQALPPVTRVSGGGSVMRLSEDLLAAGSSSKRAVQNYRDSISKTLRQLQM